MQREGFLDIDVASRLKECLCKIKVACWRCRDMHNIGAALGQQFCDVAVILLCRKTLVELPSHQRLAITYSNNLAALDSLNLRSVRISDLAAAYNSNPKHVPLRRDMPRNSIGVLPRSALWAPIQDDPSFSDCCTGSSSRTRANGCD